jgi:hypothetical protein
MRQLFAVMVLIMVGCGDNPKAECTTGMDLTQVPGDCQIAVCDNGHIVQHDDDTDLPTATACTTARCDGGVSSTLTLQPGTSCGSSLVCDQVGQCVGCIAPLQCPGMDTECQIRACSSETCGMTNTAAGTPLVSGQTAGDCQRLECDGNGSTRSVADDADVAAATNPCIAEACVNGVSSSTYEPTGTACGTGLSCDGNGACVACIIATDCPGSDTTCQQRTCTTGACGFSYAPTGTPTASQAAGDCQQEQCDGVGGTMQATDDADTPPDTECATGTCTSGVPSNMPEPTGTQCSTGVCDGSGACVGCVLAADCPASTNECEMASCTMNTCGLSPVATGTVTSTQVAADCQQTQCDGLGGAMQSNDDTDTPPDTECTTGTCSAGIPSSAPKPLGTACMTGTCDGLGSCVP